MNPGVIFMHFSLGAVFGFCFQIFDQAFCLFDSIVTNSYIVSSSKEIKVKYFTELI